MFAMDRRFVVSLAVVLVIVTAGCGTLDGDAGSDRQPYDVEEELEFDGEFEFEEESAGDGPIPGLFEDEVVDAETLAAFHRFALDSKPHVVVRKTTARYEDGTVAYTSHTEAVVKRGGTPAYSELRYESTIADDPNTSIEQWTDGDGTTLRIETADSVRYATLSGSSVSPTMHFPVRLEAVLESVDTVSVEDDGEDRSYLLESDSESVERFDRMHLSVTEDGFVEEFHGFGVDVFEDKPVAVETTVRFERVGDSGLSIDRPGWVSEVGMATTSNESASDRS